MESSSLLSINDRPLSIEEAIKYLQASGKLSEFIGDILRQYVIEQEIKTRDDLEINQALTEQAVIDFRLKNELTQPQIFQEWLKANGTNYEAFHSSITWGFKLEKLKKFPT